MPRLLPVCLLLLSFAGTPGVAAEARVASAAPTVDPFGFTEEEYSSFGIKDAPYPYSGRHGCYPVGNGVIFGHLGVAEDFALLRGLTGPGYQTRGAAVPRGKRHRPQPGGPAAAVAGWNAG